MKRPRTELVLALTSAVGTDLKPVEEALTNYLRTDYGYRVVSIRISDMLGDGSLKLSTKIDRTTEFMRYESLMDAGTEARKLFGTDALARLSISKIEAGREGDGLGTVYLVHQLKHHDEVSLLRQVYGPGFFLIGVFASAEAREARLSKDLRMEVGDGDRVAGTQARELMRKDLDEAGKEHGQKSSKAFQRADVFVQADRSRDELWRFVDLVFGDPFTTPRRDEYAMFMAHAASLRSAELGRQVGAAIFSRTHELIGVGANEVPAPGGGLYWPQEDMPEGTVDGRDFARLGYDSNHRRRSVLVEAVANDAGLGAGDSRRSAIDRRLSSITEYGRAVHAEMEALLSCARIGVSVRGGTLYTTTFPCHNCARHLIASGVRRIVFIEPYPKSLASDLHEDEILLAAPGDRERGEHRQDPRIFLEPFVGVGPRRFPDLFSTSVSSGHEIERKQADGARAAGAKDEAWKRTAVPRVPLPPTSYGEREAEAVVGGRVPVKDMLRERGE